MVGGFPDKDQTMRCTTCGADMLETITDLPFKVGEKSIVIVKDLPVLQCGACPEYLLEDKVFARVEEVLSKVDASIQLEIVTFAA